MKMTIRRKLRFWAALCVAERNERKYAPIINQGGTSKEWEDALERQTRIRRILRYARWGKDNWHHQYTIRGLESTCDRIENEKAVATALMMAVPTFAILAAVLLVMLVPGLVLLVMFVAFIWFVVHQVRNG